MLMEVIVVKNENRIGLQILKINGLISWSLFIAVCFSLLISVFT